MINVNEIVNEINKAIKGFLTNSTYSNSSLNGIAYNLLKDKENSLPAVIDHKGNATYTGIDDKYNLVTYHRIMTTTPTKGGVSQYGDGNKKTKITNVMSLVVFANREKLKLQQEVLANYILASLPTNIDKAILLKESLSECTIDVLKVDFNSSALYKREYLKESVLKPHQMLFEISYQIVYSFNSGCINTCKC